MRKIIFSVIGTSGDINPLLAMALHMKEKRFDVTFLTNDHFIPLLVELGINYFSIGTEEHYQLGNSKECWDYSKDDNSIFGLYHAPAFRPAYDYVIDAYKDNKNLMVVSLFSYDGARAAAEKLGIPKVSIVLSPNQFFSFIAPPAPFCWLLPSWVPSPINKFTLKIIWKVFTAGNRLNKWNRMHLIERKKIGALKIDGSYKNEIVNICFFPEWFGMRQKDWVKNIQLVGFPFFKYQHEPSQQEADAFIEEQGTPIIFTTGTGVQDTAAFINEAKKICSLLNTPGLFVGGNEFQDIHKSLPYFKQMKYVDFEYILPKCKAIVHHGGVGTTAAAIKAGIPQLIRPLKYDQPDNANRIRKLGLGHFLLAKNFTAELAVLILKKIIHDAPHNRNYLLYSADVKRSNAIEKACNIIERKIKELDQA
ncbi:MAG: glycosyltransferase [Pseudomonadota bacterium]